MSGLPSAHAIDAAEYAAIEATIGASERGQHFLAEHARRARAEEMATVLTAIERLERSVTAERPVDAVGSLRGGLAEMAEAISRTKAEISAISVPDGDQTRLTSASQALDAIVRATEQATSDILGAAEAVQEAAWTLRERNVEPETCEALDRHATAIYTACSFQDLTAQRTARIIYTLRYLEDRIASMIGIWGSEEGVPDLDAEARIRRDTAATFETALDQTDVDRFLDMESPAAPMAPTRPPLSAVALHEDLAFVPAEPFEGEAETAPVDVAAEAVAEETSIEEAIAETVVAEAERPEASSPDAAETDADRAVAAPAETLLAQDVDDDAVAEAVLGDLFDTPAEIAQPAAEPMPAAPEKAPAPAPAQADDLAAAFLDLDELSIEEKIALFA